MIIRPIHESNDCHEPAGSPEGGQFCSGAGRRTRTGRRRGGEGWQLVFRSALQQRVGSASYPGVSNRTIADRLTSAEERKARSAKVFLVFDDNWTAGLGAPIKWQAPNGVTVLYDRGQRRGDADETGRPSAGTYHDFFFGDEKVIPLTRNIGSGRRALRAWAAEFLRPRVTVRMQARQLVRPGD